MANGNRVCGQKCANFVHFGPLPILYSASNPLTATFTAAVLHAEGSTVILEIYYTAQHRTHSHITY